MKNVKLSQAIVAALAAALFLNGSVTPAQGITAHASAARSAKPAFSYTAMLPATVYAEQMDDEVIHQGVSSAAADSSPLAQKTDGTSSSVSSEADKSTSSEEAPASSEAASSSASSEASVSSEPAHEHEYTAVVTPPTCTQNGYTTHTCACGDTYTDSETPATGHFFGEWTTTVAATESAEGTQERSCTVCGVVEQRTIDKLPKQYAAGNYKITTALNLRAGVGTGYAVLAVIPAGAVVSVSSASGDWGAASYLGTSGYINMNYVTPTTEAVTTAPANSNTSGSYSAYGNFSAIEARYPSGTLWTQPFTNGWYATGCYGFLLQIGYEWSGSVAPLAWNTISDSSVLDNLRPGDIIYGGGHCIMVTAVSGSSVEFVHSNWKYYYGMSDNVIQWHEWTSVGALKAGYYIGSFCYVLRCP